MSGIAGIWNLDGRPVDTVLLQRLSATLAHRGPDGEFFWTDGAFGISCQLLRVTPEAQRERQPFVHASGTVVVFDGRLDDREALFKALGRVALPADCSDPELIAEAYRVFGEPFAERLVGDFAFALFDPVEHKLLLVRDPIGVRPLYYCQTGETLIFASEIKALLAHPDVRTRPHEDDLAEYLLRGRETEAGATFFKGIHGVPASHYLVAGAAGTRVRQYWDFDASRQIRFKSLDEYAEGFRHYFIEAVRRRMRSAHPVAVSVSGGIDSSAIFCVGQTIRRAEPSRWSEVLGFFYSSEPGTPSDEHSFILDIEREYGLNVKSIPLVPGFLDAGHEQVWHGEVPILDAQSNTLRLGLKSFRDTGCRVILNGTCGDQVLCERAYLIELFEQLDWRTVIRHLRTLPKWNTDVEMGYFWLEFLDALIRRYTPNGLIRILQLMRSTLRRTRKQYFYSENLRQRANVLIKRRKTIPDWGSPHQSAIYSEVRKGYHAIRFESANKLAAWCGMDEAWPFLDRDLIAFLLAIPGYAQSWDGVPKALIRAGLAGVLPPSIRRRRWKADFTYNANRGTDEAFEQICGMFRAGSRSGDFRLVDETAVCRLQRARSQLSGPYGIAARQITDLVGLEMWLKCFFPPMSAELEIPERTSTS